MNIPNTSLESLEVVFAQILLRRVVILAIAIRLHIVDGIMLACGDDLLALQSLKATLQAWDQVGDIALRVKRVFRRHLGTATPARI